MARISDLLPLVMGAETGGFEFKNKDVCLGSCARVIFIRVLHADGCNLFAHGETKSSGCARRGHDVLAGALIET